MFYEVEIEGHIRVMPKSFADDIKKAVLTQLSEDFDGFISKDLGVTIGVTEITRVGEGIIIAGDGAAYYDCNFKVLCFKPELQEVVQGKITDVTDFGAFLEMGPIDGMIHVSQTMDDYVSFSKSNVLTGKESKRSIKTGDFCRGRIIAVSYKEPTNPKIGLTMRQPLLGVLKHIEEDIAKQQKEPKEKGKK